MDNKLKVFEGHLHFTFKVPVRESVEIFKQEFEETGTDKYCFLSIPSHGAVGNDILQNSKALYYKAMFSPNAYAYAGLEYDYSLSEKDMQDDLLRQAKEYLSNGFDGFKMLEGMPKYRKFINFPLDDARYDKFYAYMEEQGKPIIMHLAHPRVFWDKEKLDEYWINRGCLYDESFPSFDHLINEAFGILKKFTNINLTLAHWGFLVHNRELMLKFMSYPNTRLDVTPGGEQYFEMIDDDIVWWKSFIEKYADRICYGTDLYQFEKNGVDNWKTAFHRRPDFVRNFFETDTEHFYGNQKFKGIKLDQKYLKKIYRDNLLELLGEPSKINYQYVIDRANELLKNATKESLDEYDLKCIIWDITDIMQAK